MTIGPLVYNSLKWFPVYHVTAIFRDHINASDFRLKWCLLSASVFTDNSN